MAKSDRVTQFLKQGLVEIHSVGPHPLILSTVVSQDIVSVDTLALSKSQEVFEPRRRSPAVA